MTGKLIEADKTTKIAGWVRVEKDSKNTGPTDWGVLESCFKANKKVIQPFKPTTPPLTGVAGNPFLQELAYAGVLGL